MSNKKIYVGNSLDEIKDYIISFFDNRNVIVFDTETTGLSPGMDQLTEIGAKSIKIFYDEVGNNFNYSETKDSFGVKVKLSNTTELRIKAEKWCNLLSNNPLELYQKVIKRIIEGESVFEGSFFYKSIIRKMKKDGDKYQTIRQILKMNQMKLKHYISFRII